MSIKVSYQTRRGASVMRSMGTYQELGQVIKNLYKARIEARAEDDLGECGAVFRHPDDNKLCWYSTGAVVR